MSRLVSRFLLPLIVAAPPLSPVLAATPAQIDIPPGDLSSALQTLASRSGTPLLYTGSDIAGRMSAGVRGALNTEDALASLLAGTGLAATPVRNGVRLIRAAAPAGADLPLRLADAAESDVGSSSAADTQEVIVTATRHADPISKVPVSVQALTADELEKSGVKTFAEMIKFAPGLNLNSGFAGGTNVAIRGIASNTGSATTGIYVDDVPVQVRNLGYSATSIFPQIFDLDRVEVLRGPQGTLFGAGSEGGTVRFIQAQPSLTGYESFSRAEVSTTQGGGPSYEVGEAIGGPIVSNLLGFRASVYYRHDGGWIDHVTAPTLEVLDPTGASGPSSARLDVTSAEKDSNYQDMLAFRLAVRYQPSDELSVTPSYIYQKQRIHDDISSFWLAASDPGSDRFATPLFSQIPGYLNPTGLPDLNSGQNELQLPSLQIEWHHGSLGFYSTTSYMRTRKAETVDSTSSYLTSYNDILYPPPGYKAPDHNVDRSGVFTQELRLQFDSPDSPIQALAGVFFSHSNQFSEEDIHPNFFDTIGNYFEEGNLDGADPFGPGSTDFQNNWGSPMLPNSGSYYASFSASDKQEAAFVQLSWRNLFVKGLTATAGVRVSRMSYSFSSFFDGPENNLNAPFGEECPEGYQPCIFNDPNGYYAPAFPGGSIPSVSETAVTPKYTLAYQVTDSNLVYATASKGFRPGGGEPTLPTVCDSPLAQLGYSESPTSYKSDSVWNYEIGTKDQLFDNRLSVDLNVYRLKWQNVQAQIIVPICGYGLIDNFGDATSTGAELQLQLRPLPGLTLSANGSYNTSTFDHRFGTATRTIFAQGQSLPGVGRPTTASVLADYRFSVGEQRFYAHVDWTYSGHQQRTQNSTPGTSSYNPLAFIAPAYDQTGVRVGTYLGPVDVSLFVNNLFDSHPWLSYGAQRDSAGIGLAAIYTGSTIMPRQGGITASVRF